MTPTPAQAEAGNYRKKHIRLHGLDIAIETPRGCRRRPNWPKMSADYGYIKRTTGADGDHVDVFVGPHKDIQLVVVIDQPNLDGEFDEHKVLIGYPSKEAAVAAYRKCYTADWKVGNVTTMTIDQFRSWLKHGSRKKPIVDQVSRYDARQATFDWDESKHPRDGGKFTSKPGASADPKPKVESPKPPEPKRTNEPASPAAAAIRQWEANVEALKAEQAAEPDPKEHPLHHSHLDEQIRSALLHWSNSLTAKVQPVGQVAQGAKRNDRDPVAAKKNAWDNYVDQPGIQKLMGDLKTILAEARESGVDLKPVIRHNDMIPRNLAPKLKPNDSLFRPVEDHERFAITSFSAAMDHYMSNHRDSPGQIGLFSSGVDGKGTLRSTKTQKKFDWDESKHPRQSDGKFATQSGEKQSSSDRPPARQTNLINGLDASPGQMNLFEDSDDSDSNNPVKPETKKPKATRAALPVKSVVYANVGRGKTHPAIYRAETTIRTRKTEKLIAFDEDGNELWSKSGGKTQVTFLIEEAKQHFRGSILTHNHPNGWEHAEDNPRRMGNSFSPGDMMVAVDYGVKQMRVISPGYLFIFEPNMGDSELSRSGRAILKKIINEKDSLVKDRYLSKIAKAAKAGSQSQSEAIDIASAEHWHEVNQLVAQHFGWKYERIRLQTTVASERQRYAAGLHRWDEVAIARYRAAAKQTSNQRTTSGKQKEADGTVIGSKGDRGRFVTIDGHPVFIESDKVSRGPRSMRGKNPRSVQGERSDRIRTKSSDQQPLFQPVTDLDYRIVDHAGNHPDDVSLFRDLMDDAHKMIRTEAEETNDDLRQLLGNFGYRGKKTSQIIQAVRRTHGQGGDASQIPRFDEMVDMAKDSFPQLLTGGRSESVGNGDSENALFSRLKEGFEKVPSKTDEKVFALAKDMMSSTGKASDYEYDPTFKMGAEWGEPDESPVPFSTQFADAFIDRFQSRITSIVDSPTAAV